MQTFRSIVFSAHESTRCQNPEQHHPHRRGKSYLKTFFYSISFASNSGMVTKDELENAEGRIHELLQGNAHYFGGGN